MEKNSTVETVCYGSYVVERLASGTIRVTRNGVVMRPTKPELRILANRLGVSIYNSKRNTRNTRQLGREVIRAIAARK